jgi:predicted anti-sigma-YlaC factor YlaD
LRSKVSSSSSDCARARESVSVQLDGELSETEFDRLETHLRFCPECAAWAEQVGDITLRLREASAEVPTDGFVLPRNGRRWRVSSAVALGSAAAVVATMFVGPGGHRGTVTLHSANATSSRTRLVRTPSVARLEDGTFTPISTLRVTFRHV